jgi:DNA-binding transcriptional regulator YiaG
LLYTSVEAHAFSIPEDRFNVTDEDRDYAALVKTLRRRLGLTQEQFAHHLGVTFASG